MYKKFINEGLDFNDMEGQLQPIVTVDEYAAKMGKDSDVVTLSFKVNSKQAGDDLVDWFERGYDFVLDSSLSEGEVEVGKYLVFVELSRRSKAPGRIIELLKDLKTLSGITLKDWTVQVNDEDYDADENVLRQIMITNPAEYRLDKETEDKLNEMRGIAGLENKPKYTDSEYIKQIKNEMGL